MFNEWTWHISGMDKDERQASGTDFWEGKGNRTRVSGVLGRARVTHASGMSVTSPWTGRGFKHRTDHQNCGRPEKSGMRGPLLGCSTSPRARRSRLSPPEQGTAPQPDRSAWPPP
eukprot:scaffold51846_cov56-Phaeocystis_antarctica.AAC.1